MAIGTKTGGKNFKPGESGNLNGRPVIPEDIKEARKLNKVEFERLLNSYIHMSPSEIKVLMGDPKTTVIEVMVAKVIAEAIKRGDERRLGFLLDRLIGPVKTKVSLDGGEDGSPISLKNYLQKSDEDLDARIQELTKKLGGE